MPISRSLLMLLLSGCGYSLTAGLPGGVCVDVPMAANETPDGGVEQMVTLALRSLLPRGCPEPLGLSVTVVEVTRPMALSLGEGDGVTVGAGRVELVVRASLEGEGEPFVVRAVAPYYLDESVTSHVAGTRRALRRAAGEAAREIRALVVARLLRTRSIP